MDEESRLERIFPGGIGCVSRRVMPLMSGMRMSRVNRQLLIGQEGIGLEEFLTKPVEHWFAY